MDRRVFIASTCSAAVMPSIRLHHNRLADLNCSAFAANGVRQCEAGIESNLLDVAASDTQHASEWCWAACIEGVFSYYGHTVPQERIVNEVWGEIVNMPGQPSQILSALSRKWTDDDGSDFTASCTPFGIDQVTAAQDLAADKPLIVGALGHAMILTALDFLQDVQGNVQVTLAIVRDPWPYNPRKRALSVQEWTGINFAARIRVTD